MKKLNNKILEDNRVSFNSFNINDETNEKCINSKKIPQHFFSIVNLFAEDCNYNIESLYTHLGRLFIKGYCNENESENQLMLRYQYDNSLTVAVVSFANKRQGNMTKLFEYLKNIKEDYDLKKIVVENTNSESIKAWCIKNNFVESNDKKNYYEYY